MSSTVATAELPSHRKRFEDLPLVMAKADLKNLEDSRRQVGKVIARMCQLAGLTQKEVARLLGHNSEAQISRWIAGTERPQFDALLAAPALKRSLVIALAELAGVGIKVQTVITVEAA